MFALLNPLTKQGGGVSKMLLLKCQSLSVGSGRLL